MVLCQGNGLLDIPGSIATHALPTDMSIARGGKHANQWKDNSHILRPPSSQQTPQAVATVLLVPKPCSSLYRGNQKPVQLYLEPPSCNVDRTALGYHLHDNSQTCCIYDRVSMSLLVQFVSMFQDRSIARNSSYLLAGIWALRSVISISSWRLFR